ncbi:Cytidine deaminase [Cyphellophora attinorum]|uniref:Cytidine deaminase n=1 Tax=Cyphellophora attinorum TaxID=1664694 RepID=A0A0N1HAE0_9EURO|nr:Cytidine deaminase [Phialophora attinorum]KPI44922.1 Cytidine deaminase [Phialophora attinorum]
MAPKYDLTDEELNKLARLAAEAKTTAYCPYSNFRVGAALLLRCGVHTGTIASTIAPSKSRIQAHTLTNPHRTQRLPHSANVEVAATPVGICAERCALAPVVASFANPRPSMPVIRALAVSTDIDPPASPCGMCRQFIREFCGDGMRVWMYGKKAEEGKGGVEAMGERGVSLTVKELLPMSFGPGDMDKRENKSTPKIG